MLDNILSIVKDIALDAVAKNTDIPKDKKELTVETTTNAISSELANNVENLAGLFSGKNNSSSIVNGIQKSVVNALMQKVGLNSSVASGLVSEILPLVINALTGKVSAEGEGGFSIESVLTALGGGDQKKSGAAGVLGKLGKLFG